MDKLNILHIEDSEPQQLMVKHTFRMSTVSADIVSVGTLEKGLEYAVDVSEKWDLVILDLGLPDSRGKETFIKWSRCCPHVPCVIFTSDEDVEVALECIALGAQEYVLKEDSKMLPKVCLYAIERWKAQFEMKRIKNLYESILNTTPDLIVRFKPDLSITYINSTVEEIVGLSTTDVEKACLVDFVHIPCDIQEALSKLTPTHPYSDVVELRLDERYISWVYSAVFDDFGDAIEYQAVGRDITYKLMTTKEMVANTLVMVQQMKQTTDALYHKATTAKETTLSSVASLQESVDAARA